MYRYIFLFLMLIPIVHAADLTLDNKEYTNLETVTGYINLENIIDKKITPDMFGLYDENNKKISIAMSILQLDQNNYFYYFTLPNGINFSRYNISLRNLIIKKNNFLEKINLTQDFNLIQKNYSVSIYPAIFILDDLTEKNLYEIKITNNLDPVGLTIKHDQFVKLSIENLNLSRNSINFVQVQFDRNYEYREGLNGFITLEYITRQYKLPVFAKNTLSSENNTNRGILESYNEREFINQTIFSNENIKGPLKFKNNGLSGINNIKVSLDGNLDEVIKLSDSEFTSLETNDYIEINISVNNEKNSAIGIYNGYLMLNYDGSILRYPITIKIIYFSNTSEEFNQTIINATENINITNQPQVTKETKAPIFLIAAVLFAFVLIIILFKRFRKKEVQEEDKFDSVISKYLKK